MTIAASAARPDGSVVLAGGTDGAWHRNISSVNASMDFMAVALDEDGAELWRWQVRLRSRPPTLTISTAAAAEADFVIIVATLSGHQRPLIVGGSIDSMSY